MQYGWNALLGATLVTTLAAGCGGGSDGEDGTGATGGGGGAGGGGSSFTSVSGTAVLGTLSAADATKLCDDTYAHFRTAISTENACKWKGLSFATSSSAPTEEQLKANCSEKETGCLADPAAALSSNPGCNDFPPGCMATVAEYSACVKDLVAAFNQTVMSLSSCSTLTKQGTDGVWAAMSASAPPSCSFSTCMGLYPPNPLY